MEPFRRALSGDTDTSLHDQEPQRKKMRKGTKSCYECRRRKIRCTYAASRPGICNECHARGSSCIDQEHAPLRPEAAKLRIGDQSYSLRERVAALEHTVSNLVKQMDENDKSGSKEHASWSYIESPTDSIDRDTKSLSNCQAETVPETIPVRSKSMDQGGTGPGAAPLLTLFDNHILSRDEKHVDLEVSRVADPIALKERRAVLALRELLPSPTQLKKLLNSPTIIWTIWRTRFPEILKPGALENPADIGKILYCILMTLEQRAEEFDFQTLKVPVPKDKYIEQCVAAVQKYIIEDDDIASSLPGIECITMAGKYQSNIGRPRKTWLLTRRAINFAQLSGLHLPNNRPGPEDELGLRKLHIWCSLACADLYQSSILGLPYSVPLHLLKPHITHLLKVKKMDPAEAYMLRVCLPLGSIIDRNQDGGNMSLPLTLKIDQELEDLYKQMGDDWWDPSQLSQLSPAEKSSRLWSQFAHHFVRMLLHLPFMLKSNTDKRCQYCHNAALESARQTIECYKGINDMQNADRIFCKVIDFQVFTATVLLIVHLLGSPFANDPQTRADWSYQSASVIEKLCSCRDADGGLITGPKTKNCNQARRIILPYFGAVNIVPGKMLKEQQQQQQQQQQQHSLQQQYQYSQQQQMSPPNSIPEKQPSTNSSGYTTPQDTPSMSLFNTQLQTPSQSSSSSYLQNGAPLSEPNLDVNLNLNLMDDTGGFGNPNLNLDLFLGQGWNFDWMDAQNYQSV
ncbi:hypothetical protein MGYG_03361 [Nannizzia gypsea CBS 118893]|uniref:Zn(2)-C6 fungal-type domain-containing protein n=1 Tax=Arthroderma gypseum (strain ATCC MYA-4604 / CBS 118893) TaxID=535722 RepID=E4UN57_ARTGP|nr:hypothetical protein MGYG_03361 [Nannizzia gypsea CBS 118893]EFR00359.1 hypothetical protein MGYG_03361 [Nannizzia gypsea CBS 118893]